MTSAMMLLVYTVVDAERVGWGAARTLSLGALALLLLAGFVLRQATAAQPLLPLGLFRSRSLAAANAVQFLLIAGMFGLLFFFGTLHLQRVLAYSPLEAGLGFVPVAVVIAVVSLGLSARLITRYGHRAVLLLGLALVVGASSCCRSPASTASTCRLPAGRAGHGARLRSRRAGRHRARHGGRVPRGVRHRLGTVQHDAAARRRDRPDRAERRRRRTHRQPRRPGQSEVRSLAGGHQVAFLAAAGFALAALLVGATLLKPEARQETAALSEPGAPVS